jgi:hypothetical protein
MFGFARQTGKGSARDPDIDSALFKWMRTSTLIGGPVPRAITLPQEMGGSMLPGGMEKLGVNGAFGGEFIPRPTVIGEVLYGLIGQCTSVPISDDIDDICDATAASDNDVLATAGKLLATAYDTTPGAATTIPGAPHLVLAFTRVATSGNKAVTISGKNEAGQTISGGEAVTIVGGPGAGVSYARTTNRFSEVSAVAWPARTTDGDKVTIGPWSGYQHTFTLPSDPANIPYYTAVRRVAGTADGFWETVTDCRFESLSLMQDALAVLNGNFSMNGIIPTQYNVTGGVDDLNAVANADAGPSFVAPKGGFRLDSTYKSDHYNPAVGKGIAVRSLSIQLAAVQDVGREFIIGSYYPADVDVIGRIVGIAATLLVTSKELYNKLQYNPSWSSGNATWLPIAYQVLGNGFETMFRTGQTIPGGDDGNGNGSPYILAITGAKIEWTVGSIALRSNDLVQMQVTGVVSQPTSGAPLTVTLVNGTASY